MTLHPPAPLANALLADPNCPSTVRMLAPPRVELRHNQNDTSAPQSFRVLHVVNGEHFAGAERVQSHLGRCLPEQGVAADFACVKPGRFAEMVDQRSELPTGERWGTVYRFLMKNRLDFSVAKRLADLVRREDYELLHAHTPRTAMIASLASKWTGKPWIYHVHSPASRDCERWVSNRINAWIERCSLKNCSHLICVSGSLREELIAQGFPAERVTVVHNGVPAIRPQRDHRPVVGGRWTIGMVALMRNRKGLEVVLDALSDVRRRGLDVQLRCIGPFETQAYRTKIDARINELQIGPQIDWVGFTDDVPGELSRLDAMVLPSLFGEGLPMVVLEAMAAAVPVIATRVEGTPEAITHGVEGLLAEPRVAHSLADQIEALVTGRYDWESMSEAATVRHEACFSDTAMAVKTATVYRTVMDQAQRAGRPK